MAKATKTATNRTADTSKDDALRAAAEIVAIRQLDTAHPFRKHYEQLTAQLFALGYLTHLPTPNGVGRYHPAHFGRR